jgi:ornithine carbamoyltransferase
MSLKGKSFLNLENFSQEEILHLINLSADLKANKKSNISSNSLKRKNIIIIFDKPSTRTRCAFEVAVFDEGGNITFLSNSHMGVKESIEDTAIVLGRMYDGIGYRGYDHSIVEELAQYSGVPVWNGLTDQHHPAQALATFLTLKEKLPHKPFNEQKIVFVGDGCNNVCTSLIIGAAKLGMNMSVLSPEELVPSRELMEKARTISSSTKANINCTSNIDEAVQNADAIYTDVWVSMGEEEKFEERIKLLAPFQVNKAMLDKIKNKDVLFMHCLPAYHDTKTKVGLEICNKHGLKEMEVTDEVFRSENSTVFDEAENRIHTIKAVMVATLGN